MNYAILKKSDIEALSEDDRAILFSQIHQSGIDTLREGVIGTEAEGYCIIKWSQENCPCEALELEHIDYTYEEILAVIATSNWTSEEDI